MEPIGRCESRGRPRLGGFLPLVGPQGGVWETSSSLFKADLIGWPWALRSGVEGMAMTGLQSSVYNWQMVCWRVAGPRSNMVGLATNAAQVRVFQN